MASRALPDLACVAAALLTVACAHAPVPHDDVSPASATARRVVVTGSHIPRPVSARTGLPVTMSPVSVWTATDLVHAARPTDLGAALKRLDPALGLGR